MDPAFAVDGQRGDRSPVDSPIADPVPPAVAASGEIVSSTEIEAAAELARMMRRLGVSGSRFDGFVAYRTFSWAVAWRARSRSGRGPR